MEQAIEPRSPRIAACRRSSPATAVLVALTNIGSISGAHPGQATSQGLSARALVADCVICCSRCPPTSTPSPTRSSRWPGSEQPRPCASRSATSTAIMGCGGWRRQLGGRQAGDAAVDREGRRPRRLAHGVPDAGEQRGVRAGRVPPHGPSPLRVVPGRRDRVPGSAGSGWPPSSSRTSSKVALDWIEKYQWYLVIGFTGDQPCCSRSVEPRIRPPRPARTAATTAADGRRPTGRLNDGSGPPGERPVAFGRMAQITLGGNPIHTTGDLPAVGTTAPDFTLLKNDLSLVHPGRPARQEGRAQHLPEHRHRGVRHERAHVQPEGRQPSTTWHGGLRLGGPPLRPVNRFCGAEGIDNVRDGVGIPQQRSATAYGLTLADSKLQGLLARAVVVPRRRRHQVVYSRTRPRDRPGARLRRRAGTSIA